MNDKIDEYLSQEEHDKNLEMVNAIIEKCLAEDVLTDFLTSRREEVQTIITYLFDDEIIMRNHDYQIERRAEQAGIAKGIQKGVEQGIKQGIEQGIEKGIRAMVEALQAASQSRDAVIQIVADKFGLSAQAAADKVAQYWG